MRPLYLTCVGEVHPGSLAAVDACLRETLQVETRQVATLPRPEYAFDTQRRQYSVVAVMQDVLRHLPGDALRLLALTECDLFIPMLSFVYGQAQLRGRAAVVSLARLRQEFYGLPPDPGLLMVRVRKEAVHEVGHTFGLVHCVDRSCAMSLSTNIRQLDLKGERFCSHCIIELQETMRS